MNFCKVQHFKGLYAIYLIHILKSSIYFVLVVVVILDIESKIR